MSVLLQEIDARGVATLTLNRSEKRNALSSELISALHEAVDGLAKDSSVRVVVLTGSGDTFCAGGDLRWMQEQMAADSETRAAEARKIAHMLRAVNELPKPIIARVQGNAFGGGIGLMSVSDVAIGVEGASFGLTETRLGMIPATIGPYVIARMGEAKARRVFMSSRVFGAEEALALGLAARIVPAEDLDAAVEAEVAPYLNCAPGAVAEAKALTRDFGPKIDDEVIEASISALIARWRSEEAQDGIAAFFAKEKAPWVI